jgi:hypothetical protein
MKKTRSKKSRDTVPLTASLCLGLGHSIQPVSAADRDPNIDMNQTLPSQNVEFLQ